MKVAMLADLAEPLGPEARTPAVIAGYEIAIAMAESATRVGRLSIDLVARRGTHLGLPLISIEPDELGPWPTDPAARQSYQDAAYCQLALTGLLDDYDLVHCVAPLVTPLQLLAAAGMPLVLTIAWPAGDPAAVLPIRLVAPGRLAVATVGGTGLPRGAGATAVPLSVDLELHAPELKAERHYLLWLGSGGHPGLVEAQEVAGHLGLPLEVHDEGCPPKLLRSASCLLLPSKAPSVADHMWAARALACGTPVVGCLGAELENVLDDPALGALAPLDDAEALATAVTVCDLSAEGIRARRDRALALHGRSAMAGRYRRLYDRALTHRAVP